MTAQAALKVTSHVGRDFLQSAQLFRHEHAVVWEYEKIAKKAPSVSKNNTAGGFNVAFKKIGINEKRAKYDRDMRTIYINLEHPRIAMELKAVAGLLPLDDPNFLRMAYEIAFTEYAIVLAQELSTIQFFLDPQDALVELRQTIDELSKSFAASWPQAASRH